MINRVYYRTNKNTLETKEENKYQQHYKEEEVHNIYIYLERMGYIHLDRMRSLIEEDIKINK